MTDPEAVQIMRRIVLGYEVLAKHARSRALRGENSDHKSE
jgi:hypothetical protein